MRVPLPVRKLIRPLIPDRFMARFRLHQHSRQVRNNVDVLATGNAARRWLATTPDTYRVRAPEAYSPMPELAAAIETAEDTAQSVPTILHDHDVVLIASQTPDAAALARMMSDPDIAAAVLAEATPPRLVGRRRTEPVLAPVAAVVRRRAWDEVGGAPSGSRPLPGLVARLKDAGYRIGLIPKAPGTAKTTRRDKIRTPEVVILAAVPMHDIGGGSRAAQLALELLDRGYHVTFAPLFGVAESADLGLRFIHPRLEQIPATELDPARLSKRVKSRERLALVELPAAAILPHVRNLKAVGFAVVYDLIDDWTSPALGGEWYRPDVESDMIAIADALVASAPDLLLRLRRTGVEPRLVPNGVNRALFEQTPGPLPEDWPSGDGPVLGYQGSLYGDWFDWESLGELAEARSDARIVVIGDARQGHPAMPPNVHLLGLKPQRDLPAYTTRFDVGLIPFVVSETTHAVSPLKVYEYLASGVPVAAAPLRALEGLKGVHFGRPLSEAVAAALQTPRPDAASMLEMHCWGSRLADLFAAAGKSLAPSQNTPARIVQRPPVHYPKRERRA